jgi:hypothetical protein
VVRPGINEDLPRNSQARLKIHLSGHETGFQKRSKNMAQILWENKTIVCDICKEREMKKTMKIKGNWLGVCKECEPKNDYMTNNKTGEQIK